jgi:magnesium transporter
MLTVYKNTPDGLTTLTDIVPGSWVHITDPSPEDVARITDVYGIPDKFVMAVLDADELARTDREESIALIVLLVPDHYTEDPADVPYHTTPLGIILTNDLIVTTTKGSATIIEEFVRRNSRTISTAKHYRLVLQLFLSVAQRYLHYLRVLQAQVDVIQQRVQKSLRNKELMDLLRYQKSLIYFRTSIESNGLMMKRLQRSQFFDLYPEDRDLLDDVLTENDQANEMTKISSDILAGMMDAYASMISNNVNDVLRILAVATIILAVPATIGTLYGMNVQMPFANHPYAS